MRSLSLSSILMLRIGSFILLGIYASLNYVLLTIQITVLQPSVMFLFIFLKHFCCKHENPFCCLCRFRLCFPSREVFSIHLSFSLIWHNWNIEEFKIWQKSNDSNLLTVCLSFWFTLNAVWFSDILLVLTLWIALNRHH